MLTRSFRLTQSAYDPVAVLTTRSPLCAYMGISPTVLTLGLLGQFPF